MQPKYSSGCMRANQETHEEIARLREELKATKCGAHSPGETAEGVAWDFGGQPENWGGLQGPSTEELPDYERRAAARQALLGILDGAKSPELRREARRALGYSAVRVWIRDLVR